jgi:hypothetical protein
MLAATASAQWQSNGERVADEPWRRSDGDFGAMLLLTAHPDEFVEQWNRPAAPGYQPRIRTVTEAARGDVVSALVLFARCADDASGACWSEVDFRVVRPDGVTYAELEGAVVWKSKPPPETQLQLAQDRLGFEIEPDDPTGVYQIHATVRDMVSDRSVHLVQTLEVNASDSR